MERLTRYVPDFQSQVVCLSWDFTIVDDLGDETLSCCSLNNPSNWPVKPISEDAKLCPGIVFRLSSLTITKALIRLDCLRLIGCDVLLAGLGIFFKWDMVNSAAYQESILAINLVHKLHLQRKRQKKEKKCSVWGLSFKAAQLSIFHGHFSPIKIKIIIVGCLILWKIYCHTSTEILRSTRGWQIKRFFFSLSLSVNKTSELCSRKNEEIVQVLRCLMKNLSSDR